MSKIIEIRDKSLQKKISVIGMMFFNDISSTEKKVLCELISLSTGGSLDISGNIGKFIKDTLNLGTNSFNTSISRLCKKDVIKKTKSIIVINPILSGIVDETEYVIRFKEPK